MLNRVIPTSESSIVPFMIDTIPTLGRLKQLLTIVGSTIPQSSLLQIQATANYLRVGRWMRDNGFAFRSRVRSREDVWAAMLDRIGPRQALYLEFGVAYGDSIEYWSRALKHPGAVLHGFDSFTGMPEDGGPWKRGQFNADGCVPRIADPRVTFFKGWFDRVLPEYRLPPHDLLVINMDADLYSSTSYVLDFLAPHIQPGTILYFDEMNHVEHEPRAFGELIARNSLAFRPISADKTLAHVSFECVGISPP
jgi:O-methyltransferase